MGALLGRPKAAATVRTCRGCGCTDDQACWPGGCSWVAPELCSECIDLIVPTTAEGES